MSQQQHDAIKAVINERLYQDKRWANSSSQGHHETAAYLAYIQDYVRKAIAEVTTDDDNVLHTVRKIAALAVACMEDNGVLER